MKYLVNGIKFDTMGDAQKARHIFTTAFHKCALDYCNDNDSLLYFAHLARDWKHATIEEVEDDTCRNN